MGSAQMTIKHYGNVIDIVYLYCNKDLTISSHQYQSIEKLLQNHGITLIPITNQSILEQVINNATISWHYFHSYRLTDDWFHEKLKGSLSSLGPRYNSNFNVETHTENLLEIFFCNDRAVAQINALKKEVEDNLRQNWYEYRKYIKLHGKIVDSLSKIPDVSCTSISECLSWPEILRQGCSNEFESINKIIAEKKRLYDVAIESKDSSASHLIEEIQALTDLANTPTHMTIDTLGHNASTLLKSKVLVISGVAGVGKSQLFANAAEKNIKNGQYTVLLLGNSFLTNAAVAIQVPQQLQLDFNFEVLLHKFEALGEQSSSYMCILIDAINESPYKDIWKIGLLQIFEQVKKFNHIKIAVSVRDGYEKLVFSDAIQDAIEQHDIPHIVHTGFREESVEATLAFLNYYGISFLPSYYLQSEMTNPLFLTLFCKYYSGENFDMFTLFEKLIERADEEAQRAIGMSTTTRATQYLVEEMADRRLASNTWGITKSDLLRLPFGETYGLASYKIPFMVSLERSGLLITSIRQDNEVYFLGYNLLEDFVCAKLIVKLYPKKEDLISYVQYNLLKIEDGKISNYGNIDIFIVICSLYFDKYHVECIEDIVGVVSDEFNKEDISRRYIESFLWRKASSVDVQIFMDFVNNHYVDRDIILRVFIENSIKENHPLNALLLHRVLLGKTLADRDHLWTTYINYLSSDDERLYQLITYFDEGKMLDGLSNSNTELLLILFTWLLTSSNRILRDKASKASIELLKREFSLCVSTLQRFEAVNDPYVFQRLYGIIFGACMKRCESNRDAFRQLAEYVYHQIFDQEVVYPDILLRDYARLILERWIFEAPDDHAFIDVSKIMPPYSSFDIPVVQRQDYYQKEAKYNGFNSIVFSMGINHSDVPGMYGDFGRYTFQSALESFESVDIVNLYHYAIQFIRDELHYSDELFGRYDCFRRSYNRHETKKIERIGKKYQWIALYNILARVSDRHLLKAWSEPPYPYKGAWDPYVRDFDPTLNCHFLVPDVLPSIQFPHSSAQEFLSVTPFPSAQNIQEWKNSFTDFFNSLPNKLLLQDTNGVVWVNLNLFDSDDNDISKQNRHSLGFSKGTQKIWMMAHGYFVASDLVDSLKRYNKRNLSREIHIQNRDVYQMFNREYHWSPASKDLFPSCWIDCEIQTGKKKIIKETIKVPNIQMDEGGNYSVNYIEKEIERTVPEDGIHMQIMPAYSRILWEEQYDASQSETTAFDIPCKDIINYFHLEQKEFDGYYYSPDGTLVCFDAALPGLCQGLLIRKEYLEIFLSNMNFALFWVCIGEKQFFHQET